MSIENDIINNETEVKIDNGFYNVFTREEPKPFEIGEEAKKQSEKFTDLTGKYQNTQKKLQSFEILKTYEKPNLKKQKEEEFSSMVDSANESTDEEVITYKKYENENQKFRLKPKAKMYLISFSIIITMLAFLCIFNAVNISNLNKSISQTNNQIGVEDAKINKIIENYSKLTDKDAIIEEIEDQGYSQIEESDKIEIDLYEEQEIAQYSKKSSWWNGICNFVSGLFGG